jgi:hypothetical protein
VWVGGCPGASATTDFSKIVQMAAAASAAIRSTKTLHEHRADTLLVERAFVFIAALHCRGLDPGLASYMLRAPMSREKMAYGAATGNKWASF